MCFCLFVCSVLGPQRAIAPRFDLSSHIPRTPARILVGVVTTGPVSIGTTHSMSRFPLIEDGGSSAQLSVNNRGSCQASLIARFHPYPGRTDDVRPPTNRAGQFRARSWSETCSTPHLGQRMAVKEMTSCLHSPES